MKPVDALGVTLNLAYRCGVAKSLLRVTVEAAAIGYCRVRSDLTKRVTMFGIAIVRRSPIGKTKLA